MRFGRWMGLQFEGFCVFGKELQGIRNFLQGFRQRRGWYFFFVRDQFGCRVGNRRLKILAFGCELMVFVLGQGYVDGEEDRISLSEINKIGFRSWGEREGGGGFWYLLEVLVQVIGGMVVLEFRVGFRRRSGFFLGEFYLNFIFFFDGGKVRFLFQFYFIVFCGYDKLIFLVRLYL